MKRRDFHKLLLGTASTALAAGTGVMGDGLAYAATPTGGLTSIVQPEPPILVLALNQQLPTMQVAGKIYESLLDFDLDLNPKPQLAEEWSISEDGLTYTFKLVKNAKWHDGEPFTAADVVFTCTELLPAVHPLARDYFSHCESITALDDHTVEFRLDAPFAPFLLCFESSSSPMMPKHLYEGTDFRNAPANDTPVGTGPFKFSEWQRGQHIHLVAFEDYYREGQPGLTEIWYQIIPDAASRSVAIETGSVQLAQWGDIETFDVARLAAMPGLEMTTKGYEFYSPVLWYEVNLRKAPFNDLRFRKAMMHLLDKDFIVERIMFGLAAPATGPVASTTKYYDPQIPQYDFDVDAANAILDEMGMTRGENGIRTTIRFLVAPYGEIWTRLAEYFRQAMSAGGIEVILDSTDVAGWGTSVANWDYEVSTNMIFQYGDPALGVSRSYVSTNIRKGVLFTNTQGYENPEVDRLFTEASQETNDARRQELYTQLQTILAEELPVLWMTEQRYATIYSDQLKDLIVSANGVNANFARAHFA
ncbi:ABC transporter substrate-binding protein [Albibacillus kandeliae]|uniref:ABC transporter substrate-binding protein n=1 Tax=Albibacillus kandeliae TaxID=2174228 RepID=UPI000D695A7D|nr:ABC transporter substrate-binding protein [Albibacillus kandeliae]